MRWLYRMLRLWKCPHKWEIAGKWSADRWYADAPIERFKVQRLVLQCRRCGITRFNRSPEL